MKNWLIASALLSVVSCTRNPTLLVTVQNIPGTARSLQVESAHAGFSNAVEIEPYELPEPTPPASTFLLRLPANFSGDIGVSVGAFNQAAGKGCLVGTGSNGAVEFLGPDAALTISMDAANDMACTGKKPILLAADPTRGKTDGGEMIKLTGWGFKPDGAVTMGNKSAMFTFGSSSQITVTTPARAGFGLTPIRFANKDGNFDSRKDLFRFYTETVLFTAFPLNNNVAFNDLASFAVGVFDPTTTLDLAITLPTDNQVRIEYTVGGMVVDAKKKIFNVGNAPGPLATADFDRDGDLDVIVVNTGDRTLQLLRNTGTGDFTLGTAAPIGRDGTAQILAITAGDLNKDGVADLVVADKLNGEVQILLNNGDGTFVSGAQQIIDVGNEPVSLALGDLDSDGLLDIAVANQAMAGNGTYGLNILLNTGAGVFSDRTGKFYTYPACAMPTNVQMLDLDSNGKDDLIMACTGENILRVVSNNGNFPNFSSYDLATQAMPRNMTLADLNGDGFPDLIVPAQGANRLNLFLNKQGMGFDGQTYVSRDPLCPGPYQVASLDIDGDGKFDLGAAGNGTAGRGCLSVLFNQSL